MVQNPQSYTTYPNLYLYFLQSVMWGTWCGQCCWGCCKMRMNTFVNVLVSLLSSLHHLTPASLHMVTIWWQWSCWCKVVSKVNVDLYSAFTQTPLTRSDMDHTVLPANNTISAFTPQSQSITALWPVLIAPTQKGWPGWVDLGGWLNWDKFPAPGV